MASNEFQMRPTAPVDDDAMADDGDLDEFELAFELEEAEMQEAELLRAVLATFSAASWDALPGGGDPHAGLIDEIELEMELEAEMEMDEEGGPWFEDDIAFS